MRLSELIQHVLESKKDLEIVDNVSKSDARKLQKWWSRKGHVYLKAPYGRGKHGPDRFSVHLQRGEESPITEAPIEDWGMMGNWEKNSGFKDVDRGILTSPKGQAKIYDRFSKTAVPFHLYFVNMPSASKHREIGRVDEKWLRQNMPVFMKEYDRALSQGQIKGFSDDAINVIFTNNVADQKVPMTAWTIAHRIGHAFYAVGADGSRQRRIPSSSGYLMSNSQYEDFHDMVYRESREIITEFFSFKSYGPEPPRDRGGFRGLEGADWGDRKRPEQAMYKAFWTAIGTFKSAREGKIRQFFEFFHEMLAQYITTGRIKFRVPTYFGVPGRFGHLSNTRSVPQDKIPELTEAIENFERACNDYMHYMVLPAGLANIYVM